MKLKRKPGSRRQKHVKRDTKRSLDQISPDGSLGGDLAALAKRMAKSVDPLIKPCKIKGKSPLLFWPIEWEDIEEVRKKYPPVSGISMGK